MSRNSVTVLAGVGAALLAFAPITPPVASGQDKAASPQLKVGQPAPRFTAETTDGKKIALADYRGKSAVLLVFYWNWADDSKDALDQMRKIDDKYRPKGIQVIGVALEKERDGAAALAKLLKVGFPVIFDPKYKIAEDYQVPTGLRKGGATPYYVVVGRDSKVAGNGDIDDTVWGEDGPLGKAVRALAETK